MPEAPVTRRAARSAPAAERRAIVAPSPSWTPSVSPSQTARVTLTRRLAASFAKSMNSSSVETMTAPRDPSKTTSP